MQIQKTSNLANNRMKVEIKRGNGPQKSYVVTLQDDEVDRQVAKQKLESNWHQMFPVISINDELYQLPQAEAQKYLDQIEMPRRYAMIQQFGENVTEEIIGLINLFPEVEHITIIANKVTDKGILSLHGLQNLKWFCLYSKAVTDESLTAIQQFISLDSLDLQGSPGISVDSAFEVRKKMVHIRDYWPPNPRHA
jgi:hypothetical protein